MRATFRSVDTPNRWEVSRPGVCNFDGLFGGGGTQTSTQTNTMDPFIKGLLTNSANRAQSIADRPFESYMGQGFAPLSQNQRTALTGAQNLNAAGAPAIDMGINGAGGLLNYNPQQVGGSNFTNMLGAYQNPYTDQVVDRSLADIERQRQMAMGSNTDQAIASKAFAGAGSRRGVADALTNEAYGRIAGDTAANLRNQGFNTSAGLAQQAGMANQSADLAGAGVRSNASGLLGSLGQQQFNNGLGYVNALTQTGAMEQQTQQGQNQFDYNEFLRRMNYPAQGQTLINQSLGMLPSGGTTTTTQPGQSMLPGLLGAGVKLATAPTSNGGSLFSNWLS